MPDLLIRNFPAAELQLLDEQAKRLGLSRTEFLRRQLVREARRTQSAVTAADLAGLADLVADLDDPSVMRDAWP
ncbi:MAG: antitoxin [Actinomycetales bacterium]|nr:antitoxin [Actinomycetales bacterium]